MNKISGVSFCLFLLIFGCGFSTAQNLVPNPSFETITSCPPGNSGISGGYCPSWQRPPGSITTPDLFNTCAPNVGGCFAVNVPNTFLGVSNAFHGNSFAGILTYYQFGGSNAREYVQCQLTSPLSAGVTYQFSMRVKLGPLAHYETNRMGALVTVAAINQPGNQPIIATPTIEHPAVIPVQPNWTLVTGTFVATGGEQYLTIGNFYNDAQTIINNNGAAATGCLLVDGTGEYFVDSVSIAPLPSVPILLASNDTTICAGDSITLHVTGSSGYSWFTTASALPILSTDDSLRVAPNSLTGYVVTDGNLSDTVWVSVIPNVQAFSLGADTALCPGQTLTLNATQAGMLYQWQDNSSNPTFWVNAAGLIWVNVANACDSKRDSIVVAYAQNPSVNLGADTTLCAGQSIVLDAGTSGVDTWAWSTGASTQTITVTQAGTYSVNATGYCGIVSDAITITFVSQPQVSLPADDTLCSGQTIILDISQSVPANYLWQNGSTNPTFTASVQGIFWGQASNQCGTDRDSIQLFFRANPSVTLGPDTTLCQGQSFTLFAQAANAWSMVWQDNSTGNSIVISTPGTYSVNVSNPCGTASAAKVVTGIQIPSVNLGPDQESCEGGVITMNATFAGASYLWENGYPAPVRTVIQSGQYWVDVFNACGSASDTLVFTIHPNPVIGLGSDSSVCAGNSVLLSVGDTFINYHWETPGGQISDAEITAILPGKYFLVVTDEFGCSGGDEWELRNDPCTPALWMPNAFTPNGDGKNESFLPVSKFLEVEWMEIYDRWGKLIFRSEKPVSGWDGKFNSVECPEGVYLIKIGFMDRFGENGVEVGSLILIR